jgi:hypothetical protein
MEGPTTNTQKALELKEQGNRFVLERRWDEACEAYTQGIKLNPQLTVLFNNRALCHLELLQWKDAIDDCTTVLLRECGIQGWMGGATSHNLLTKLAQSHLPTLLICIMHAQVILST